MKMIRICLILIALFLATTTVGYGQQAPVRASVDRQALTENDLLTLTLTIDTESDTPRVTLPNMDVFTTVRTSRDSRMSIVAGVISRQYTYLYLLRPTQTGQLTIDPIVVTVDGQTYNTNPIQVEVTAGSGGATTPDGIGTSQTENLEFFVEAEIDNPNPYLGEQVIYTHRLYTAFTISQPSYDLPRFTGFWAEEEPVATERIGRANGRRYTIRETRIILFPTRTGPLTIDETLITSRSSIFSAGFVLQTEPIDLVVKPLPEDAPEDFEGAVGLFTIEAEVSNNLANVDEPITLLVTLTGQGNISTAPEPNWPDMPEWRVFDAQASTFSDFRNGQLLGRRIYERLMVPGIAGNFTYPAISYTYFDPQEQEFRTVSSEPINLEVLPGSGQAVAPVVIGANKAEIERIGADIRHIKPAPTQLTTTAPALTSQMRYWSIWLGPVVLFALSFVWSRRRQYLRRNVALTRRTQALKRARQALSKARTQSPDLYIAAGQILNTYLADKFNQPVVGLTQDGLANLLRHSKIDDDLITRVRNCLVESDMGRFGPGGNEPDHAPKLLDRIERLITALEKAFNE